MEYIFYNIDERALTHTIHFCIMSKFSGIVSGSVLDPDAGIRKFLDLRDPDPSFFGSFHP